MKSRVSLTTQKSKELCHLIAAMAGWSETELAFVGRATKKFDMDNVHLISHESTQLN